MKRWQQIFPFLCWSGDLRRREVLRTDLIAGITVALVLIPQSMAYAQLAGLPPYYGLYAAFLPPLVAALFGSSRQLATGPVAVVSLLTAAALEPLATAGGDSYVAYAVLLALMVGLFQLALGVLRLGVLVNFLSHPVVLGFTNAAAIIIATSQLGKILGVSVDKAAHHYETVWHTLLAGLHGAHLPTLGMALLAFAIMIGLRRLSPRLPGVLIAVLLTTLLSWQVGFEQKRSVVPAQVASDEVRQVLEEQLRLRREANRLALQLAQAEQDLKQARADHGEDGEFTLAVLHRRDSLRAAQAQRLRSLRDDYRELAAQRFVQGGVDGDQPGAWYLQGSVPAGLSAGDRVWRLQAINDDGNLLFHAGGAVVGDIPRGLPGFQVPRLDWEVILQLLTAAVTIALIGFMEAIAIAKSMAARTRQRLDANQELVGQGIANMVGSLFQGYAVAGSFSRSAVNLEAGAVTGLSSVVTSLVVVATLLWFTPLLYHLPQATLAAVIMVAVVGLVRIGPIRHAWRAHRHDGAVAVITFVLTLVLAPHLDLGILAGVALSLGLYLYRSMEPRLAVLSLHPDGVFRDARRHGLQTCENIAVIRFDGSLYFANTGYFEDHVLEKIALKPGLKFVIVDAEGINEIDATGEEMIRDLVRRLDAIGIKLLFARMKQQSLQTLQSTGLAQQLGEGHFFPRIHTALAYAREQLGSGHTDAEHCPLRSPPVDKQ